MHRAHLSIPCERDADDSIAHGQSAAPAHGLKARIAARWAQCQRDLHPEKTPIVSCQEAERRGRAPHDRFDLLGDPWRPRRSKHRWGKYWINFRPAVSARATKPRRQTIRSWRLHLRRDKTRDDLSRMCNPILRGWVHDYGPYDKAAL
jgi:RNA-directed DNA polymerase